MITKVEKSKEKARLQEAAQLLKLLSHPIRLSILCNLMHKGEMNVGAIVAAETGLASQSHVSQFLARMREEGLVTTRREAQTIYYRIKSPQAKKVIATLYALYCSKK